MELETGLVGLYRLLSHLSISFYNKAIRKECILNPDLAGLFSNYGKIKAL